MKKLPVLKGFTLVEVSVVGAIFFALVGLATINFFQAQRRTQVTGNLSTFLADMKGQQIKAMVGDTEGSASASAYGVHFESTTYTLFRNNYGTNNFVVTLPTNLTVSATSSGDRILFASGSGNLVGTTSATILFNDSATSTQKTVTLNRYGVVTGIN